VDGRVLFPPRDFNGRRARPRITNSRETEPRRRFWSTDATMILSPRPLLGARMSKFAWIATVVALFVSGAARADEVCNLRRAAVLDAKLGGSNHLYLPAEFDGRNVRLLLDTGGGWSVIKEPLAQALGLKPKKLRTIYYLDIAGGRITHYVTVPSFKLGNIRFPESDFLMIPKDADGDIERWAGTLGAERLSDFDVHIDNASKTVALYRPDIYCSGRVTPWTGAAVEIPFIFNNEIPELRLTVQGEKVRSATFDTGSSDTLMDLDLARSAFGITPSSPGVEAEGEQTMISGKKLHFYSYTFKTLDVSGIVFDDVRVTLGDFEDTPFVLGMAEIAKLNLYIAFKRKIIYATRIEAPKDEAE
jgi:predicted aspartyl protease